MNATCRADEEDFYALSQELLQVINFTEINEVVRTTICLQMYIHILLSKNQVLSLYNEFCVYVQ